MTLKELIKRVQKAFKDQGENIDVDGDYGPETTRISEKFEVKITVKKLEEDDNRIPLVPAGEIPWKKKAEEDFGKKETDAAFAKKVVGFWPKVGLNLKTIATSWSAWCGVGVAMWLTLAGFPVQHDGAAAKNWAKYGQAISWKANGLPEGAIVHINHNAKCTSSSNNHVTLANGSCTAADLAKPGATFGGLGGNQGNKVKVSGYPVKNICAVRWPPNAKLPGKVLVSKNCSSLSNPNESTR